MTPRTSGRRRATALLVAGGLLAGVALAGCGDDDDQRRAADDESVTDTTEIDRPTSPIASAPEPSVERPPDSPVAAVLDVEVRDGDVIGGGRREVALGESVVIRVTSDVADHVHLHGYDVMVDVAAGGTSDLAFDATIPGVFEVELEDSGIALMELEIS